MNPLKNEPVIAGVSLVGVALWVMTFVEWTPEQEAGFVTLFVALAGYLIRRYVTPTQLAEARVEEAIATGQPVTTKTAVTPRG